MVWILIWLQLTTSQSMSYYHIDTFDTQDDCVAELSKAAVLVTNKTQLWIVSQFKQIEK